MSTTGTPSARFAASSGDAPPVSCPPRVARPQRPLDAPSRFAFAASAAEAPSTSGGAQGGGSHPRPPGDVDFDNLDKTKFFLGGAALFSGVTTCLYPLTVIKTRQMVGDGLKKNGAFAVAKEVIKTKGVAGLYRGFGTVVVGTVPIRAVYLSVLEITKARARDACVALDLPPMAHGLADAAGGAVASSCSQILGVPVDVLSQRQMVQGVSVRARDGTGGTKELIGYRNGAHALKETLRKEGVRGLYRGFGASVMTLVPSSALWWGAYGTYQRAIWAAVPSRMGGEYATSSSESESVVHPPRRVPAESTVIGVQILSGVCAGMTSGFLTTPLDIVKTRLQVLSGQPGGEAHTFGGTARALYAEHGAAGFLRGVRPRMTSVSIWGTTMVTAYEFLKRLASVDDRHE